MVNTNTVSLDDPLQRFREALQKARATESFDASRCALATATADGVPSVRFVLIKHLDTQGVVFFTHYESRKAEELAQNPHAALCAHWATIGVQVRAEGPVSKLSEQASDTYFATRPRGSQIGAWASTQSQPLTGPNELRTRVRNFEVRFQGQEVPRPPNWGGFHVKPQRIEFWFNQPDRLHQRTLYVRAGDAWNKTELYP